MDALIAYPENSAQMAALKAVMKALKIAYEQTPDIYPTDVVEGVKRSLTQAHNGELKTYNSINDLLPKL